MISLTITSKEIFCFEQQMQKEKINQITQSKYAPP